MDDLISRAAALRCIMQSREDIDWGQSDDGDAFLHYTGTLYRTMASSDCVPAVDAVPVVRCKDCKYSDTFADTTTATMPLKCLNIRYGGVYPDWYCEHGERRDDDETDRRR